MTTSWDTRDHNGWKYTTFHREKPLNPLPVMLVDSPQLSSTKPLTHLPPLPPSISVSRHLLLQVRLLVLSRLFFVYRSDMLFVPSGNMSLTLSDGAVLRLPLCSFPVSFLSLPVCSLFVVARYSICLSRVVSFVGDCHCLLQHVVLWLAII